MFNAFSNSNINGKFLSNAFCFCFVSNTGEHRCMRYASHVHSGAQKFLLQLYVNHNLHDTIICQAASRQSLRKLDEACLCSRGAPLQQYKYASRRWSWKWCGQPHPGNPDPCCDSPWLWYAFLQTLEISIEALKQISRVSDQS